MLKTSRAVDIFFIFQRNSMDTTNMIAVVTKEPCKECKPVLRYLGTRRMYYPEDKKQTPNDKSNSSKNANDYFVSTSVSDQC